jgi:hypothetical protein
MPDVFRPDVRQGADSIAEGWTPEQVGGDDLDEEQHGLAVSTP